MATARSPIKVPSENEDDLTWPVMTLFYDYNMLSFVGIFDTEIFDICFSKSSKQVHKIIISKDFI